MVVAIGLASQVLGGGGYGAVIRIEHQETDRTALGAEIAIARGVPDGDPDFWLFGLRGYGRTSSLAHDWTAVTYGTGATALTTGLILLQANASGAVSYPSSHFEPYLAAGLALSVPVRDGEPFGDMVPREPVVMHDMGGFGARGPVDLSKPTRTLAPVVFVTFEPGFVVPLGDTGHALSLEIGTAAVLAGSGGYFTLSVADSAH